MPDSLEFPWMRRAVVPLMRAWDAVVQEFVTDWLPSFPAVIGSLYQLSKPGAELRGVKPIGIAGRTLQMVDLPARKVRAAQIPTFALAVRSQDESTLACAHQK